MASVVSTLSPGLAKDYDKKKSYSKGNFVLHRNSYWKCRADIGPETWTEEHWEKIEEPMQAKADLENGKIPYEQIPEMMDDVLEYATLGDFPDDGTSGKIYVAKDTGKIYRLDDDTSEYVEISKSDVVSVNGKDGEVVLTAGDIGYGDGGSGEDTVKSVLDDTYRKDEVDSLVQSNASHYRGYYATWPDVPSDASLYPEDDDGNRVPGPNDYIAVGNMSDYPSEGDSSDSSSPEGDEYSGAWRMTYSGSWDDHGKDGWQPAFQYNESPLTEDQQKALDSGITSQKVGKLDALPDADTLAGDFAAKQDKLSNAQISAIDSVVDERKTVVTYTDDTNAEFDVEGELTYDIFPDKQIVESVKIGTAVTSIGSQAFEQCGNLRGVMLPNSITTIGEYAFNACYTLPSITIPNSVTNIGEVAFGGCFAIKNITIPKSVTHIGTRAFENTEELTSCIFEGRSIHEVQAMANYPWSINTPITTWNDASKEWVENQIPTVPTPVAPSTDASAQGKPADAKDTGDALAGKQTSLSVSHVESPSGLPLSLSAAIRTAQGITAIIDIPTNRAMTYKADAADLRYRIAEAGFKYQFAASAFPITFMNTISSTAVAITAGDAGDIAWDVQLDGGAYVSYNGFDFAYFSSTGDYGGSQPGIDLQFNGVAAANAGEPLVQILSDRTVNLITATDETSIDIELPESVTVDGVRYARDFLLDVDNSANANDLALEFTGLDVDYAFVPLEDDSISEMMTIGAGERVRLYFTETPYHATGSLPVINVASVTLGDFVTSTTPATQGGN